MANFAKAQLLKYGWTEGKGLGKNENGITEALKPKLKFNTEGIGHKTVEEVHWWESAFNNAAKNVSIASENDGVSISVIDQDAGAVTENLNTRRSRQDQYNSFLKTSMLQGDKLIMLERADGKTEKEEKSTVKIPSLTDEELFKACGGRTAHKGARHGLGLSGKLERIAQQEMKLLNLMTNQCNKEMIANKSRLEIGNDVAESDDVTSTTQDDSFIKCKATLKKEKKRMQHLTRLLNISCNIDENNSGSNAAKSRRGSKRKRSNERKTNANIITITNDNTLEASMSEAIDNIPLPADPKVERKNRKRKKHHRQNTVKVDDNIDLYDSEPRDSVHSDSLKSKKAKRKNREDGETNTKGKHGIAIKKLKYNNKKITKLMEKMNFGNSNEDNNSNEDVTKSLNTFSSNEASRLNLRITKKKKNRLRKKNKEKMNLEKCVNAMFSQDKVGCIAENLMSINITEDVSTKLQKSSKQAKKEKKLKNKIEKKNNNEDRTDT